MIKLESAYRSERFIKVLYDLLAERPPEANISHRQMPTMEEHEAFVAGRPYPCWYIIVTESGPVGSIYITKDREVGIFVFKAHQGKGYASAALTAVKERWPGKMIANISPKNEASIAFFTKRGARHIQNTYSL